ncbi:hypothetical protein RNZ50_22170 [Paracoccaceae bacterium Fryx2]|nr:hypothetical protein [Paracoccaceae bacterium Fryx2]
MAGHDNLHSRVVAWLKIVLPLAALGLLSTLFLVSRSINPEDAIPYATVDVADRIREPRITAPTYAGVTADGAALTFSADEARPDTADQGRVTAATLRATLATPDGASTEVRAHSGLMDTANRRLTLGGGVEITTSTGYHVTTDGLIAALDRTRMDSAGAIAATGPIGNLSAGRMTLSEDAAVPGAYLLVFTGRVKLIYEPAN